MVDWIRTIAIGGAIAAQGCVLEETEDTGGNGVDDDDTGADDPDDGDTGNDAPADESASHTSEVDTDDGDDDDASAQRIPLECIAPVHDGCDLLRERDDACESGGTDVGYGSACEELVAGLFPHTAACCDALVEFMTCVAALPCDGTGCTLDPDSACSED
jgi:hypothetical protein